MKGTVPGYVDHCDAKHWGVRGAVPDGGHALATDALPHPGLSLFGFEHTNQPEAALPLKAQVGVEPIRLLGLLHRR